MLKNIQSKIEIALTSGTTWTLIGIAAYNGLTAIVPQLSGVTAVIVNAVLLILAGYLHADKVQAAAITGSTTGTK